MNSSILRCRKPISRRAAVLLSTLFPLILLSAHAQIVVNSTGDGSNGYPSGFGSCDTNAFDNVIVCTLRAAIEVANGNPNVSTITFDIPTTDPGYNAQTHSWTIYVNKFFSDPILPDLSTNINIVGPGAAKLTIDGKGLPGTFRGLRVFNVTATGTVAISGITIANGGAPDGESGGGINNANGGTLNITNCTLVNNVAGRSGSTGKDINGGGAIFSNGTLNVTKSTFKLNLASFDRPFVFYHGGAAIYNKAGIVNITNSTFQVNHTNQKGGAIFNDAGTVTVTGSTFERNGASVLGGGIINVNGTTSITNSTFLANIAYSVEPLSHDPTGAPVGAGGAICNDLGTVNVSNCTVTGNFATDGGGVSSSNGPDIITNVKSSIIANNISIGSGPDVSGTFHSLGFNLIGKKDGSTGFTAATDKKGTIKAPLDPKLDGTGLRSNGGSTQTVALLPGSPAIDEGSSVTAAGTTLTTDQRGTGFPRVHDNGAIANAAGGNGTDIGAFELQTP